MTDRINRDLAELESTPGKNYNQPLLRMSDMMTSVKNFVNFIVSKIVDNPDEVEITTDYTTKNILVRIKCMDSDVGKILGKKGKNIDSIKILTKAMKNTFFNDNRDISIEVLEQY